MKTLGLALYLAIFPAFAFAGNEGGHGGDPYALEFATIGTHMASSLQRYEGEHPELFIKWHFKAEDFANAVSSVRVVSDEGENVVLRGQEVDAINTPERNQILVNRTRWREDDIHARIQLVMHEYFGILNVERDRYDASMDFNGFVLKEAKSLANAEKTQLMANLFYGRCISVPPLTEESTCKMDPDKLERVQACAKTQAEGKCRLSGKAQCEVIVVSQTEKLSSTALGLRYCEVVAIIK